MEEKWMSKSDKHVLYETALSWRIKLDDHLAGRVLTRMKTHGIEKNPLSLRSKKGFGLNEVIGIAAGIIIAALVVIPGLRNFAEGLMTSLETWWTNMSSEIFNQT